MATTVIDRGVYCIRWQENGTRKSISLPGKKFGQKTVDEVCRFIDKLVYYKRNPIEVPDQKTQDWLKSVDSVILTKLAKVGLILIPESHTVGELWSEFLKAKKNIKESTRECYDNSERRFFAFFDRKTDLNELSSEHFEDWKIYLQTEYESPVNGLPLVEATVAGTVSRAKAVFNWAKSKKWIVKSPLDGVKRGDFVNKNNEQFVPMDDYYRLLDACPCQDWRCIIALARIGGLRAPSEVLRLKWTDINWERNRFYVMSSKTKPKDKKVRLVPLWSLLREELERLYFTQPKGTEFVITRYRDPERTNLGTQFARIVKMAGLDEIVRPFDNMRMSRSNEVYASDGPICESDWIGHSIKTAKKHYLRVQETDFERTLENDNPKPRNIAGLGNNFPTSVLNFPTTSQIDSDHISDPQRVAISRMESQQEKMKALQTL